MPLPDLQSFPDSYNYLEPEWNPYEPCLPTSLSNADFPAYPSLLTLPRPPHELPNLLLSFQPSLPHPVDPVLASPCVGHLEPQVPIAHVSVNHAGPSHIPVPPAPLPQTVAEPVTRKRKHAEAVASASQPAPTRAAKKPRTTSASTTLPTPPPAAPASRALRRRGAQLAVVEEFSSVDLNPQTSGFDANGKGKVYACNLKINGAVCLRCELGAVV